MLQRVKMSVEAVGGDIIGVVLNNVDINSDNTYGYYTTYYNYYTADDRNHKGDGKRRSKAGTASSSMRTVTSGQKKSSYRDVF